MNTADVSIAATERLATESENSKGSPHSLRALIEIVPVGIVFCDKDGRITDANAEILRMFGYNRHELVGQLVEKLIPERFRSSHKQQRFAYTTQPLDPAVAFIQKPYRPKALTRSIREVLDASTTESAKT